MSPQPQKENKDLDIAYLISHGFAARMVLQTGLLARLVKQGYKVGLITNDAEDAVLKQHCEENNIQIIAFNAEKQWSEEYLNARKYFLEDIDQNPALLEKHIRAVQTSASKNPWKRLRPYFLYYGVYKLSNHFTIIKRWFKQYEANYLVDTYAQDFLRQYKCRAIVSTYPVNLNEAILLQNAKIMGLKRIIHLLSWDNITCKGVFPCDADDYIAWGKIMEEEFKTYYHATDTNIYPCGVPHFDVHFEIKNKEKDSIFEGYLKSLGLDSDKPYLFFAMSAPYFTPHEIDVVEWLAAQVSSNVFGQQMQLIVRPHPQNVKGTMADLSWLPRLNKLNNTRVAIDFPSLVESKLAWSMQQDDMLRLSTLLRHATVTINSGSTVSIDALMLDRPVVVSAFDADKELVWWRSIKRAMTFPHYKKLIATKGVRVAHDFSSFQQHILDYIANPLADWDDRQTACHAECSGNDGKATERVITALTHILHK